MIAPRYRTQVDLLLKILPYVAKEEVFALKGGTAINLFVRDLPRLSVDIDLTYLERFKTIQEPDISEEIFQELRDVTQIDLKDFFIFISV